MIASSDGSVHAHELNRYQFIARHMDFITRRGVMPFPEPPLRVGRHKVCVEVGVGLRC